MEGGERKEEASLPPDYVSLAQLQERWLQKQEEMKRKRKQKREEEEKRERDARAQEEDEKRERDAWAQNERNRNRNQREGASLIQEKGKGKEIVRGGLGNGGENNKKKGKNVKRKKGRNFKGAAAVEEKKEVGAEAEAEVLSGGVETAAGGAGEGGSGGGSSGVEEVGNVCVVEVLPRNGEIAHVERTDLRGGFKKNLRNKGSRRVNELKQSELAIDMANNLKQSELAIDLEKEGQGEMGRGKMRRGGERGRGSERGEEIGEEKGRGSERGGEKGRGRERGEEGGRGRGEGRGRGRGKGEDRRRRRGRRSERGEERGRGRGGERGRNGGDPERRINMEYKPVVLEGNEVESNLENKAEDEISEVCSEITGLRVQDGNGIRGRDNKAKEDGAEGEGSDGDKVTVGIEKVDHRVLASKGENKGFGTGYQAIGIWGRDNKAKEEGVEGECSNGEIVAVELEKKADHKVLPGKGENRGFGRGYRANGIWGRDNKAKEDGVEGGGSNGDKVAVEIEKKVDCKVLPRKGENMGFGRAYRANGSRGGGFGRRRRYTRPEIYDDCKMKWRESGKVWVKKEDKLGA